MVKNTRSLLSATFLWFEKKNALSSPLKSSPAANCTDVKNLQLAVAFFFPFLKVSCAIRG